LAWGAEQRTSDVNPLTPNTWSKPIGEFLIAIANQKPQRFRALGHDPRQLPNLLNDPWRVRIRRTTGLRTAAARLDEKKDVEPLQPDRVVREEIDANIFWPRARTNSATSSRGAYAGRRAASHRCPWFGHSTAARAGAPYTTLREHRSIRPPAWRGDASPRLSIRLHPSAPGMTGFALILAILLTAVWLAALMRTS